MVLYFGDLDPSGWEMLPAMMETLQNEMKLGDLVVGERCALTVEQVNAFRRSFFHLLSRFLNLLQIHPSPPISLFKIL